jgi:WD40 repeat protein
MDKMTRVWDAQSGVQKFPMPAVLNLLRGSLSISKTGRLLTAGSLEPVARLWDLKASGVLLRQLQSDVKEGNIHAGALSADGRYAATASTLRVTLWDAETGLPLKQFNPKQLIDILRFSPDSRTLVAAGRGWQTARAWNLEDGGSFDLEGHHDGINSIEFNAIGSEIITASKDGSARLWDARSGEQIGSVEIKGAEIRQAKFASNGERIWTLSSDEVVRVWPAFVTLQSMVDYAKVRVKRQLTSRQRLEFSIEGK